MIKSSHVIEFICSGNCRQNTPRARLNGSFTTAIGFNSTKQLTTIAADYTAAAFSILYSHIESNRMESRNGPTVQYQLQSVMRCGNIRWPDTGSYDERDCITRPNIHTYNMCVSVKRVEEYWGNGRGRGR